MRKEEKQRKVREIKDTSKSLRDKGKFNEKWPKMERNEAKMMSAEKCWNASSGNKNPADKRRLKKGLMSEGHLSACDRSPPLITHTINQTAVNHRLRPGARRMGAEHGRSLSRSGEGGAGGRGLRTGASVAPWADGCASCVCRAAMLS